MIRQLLSIALLYLKRIAQNRAVLLSQILLPLVLTFIVGQATADVGDVRWNLDVVDQDGTDLSRTFVSYLENVPSLDVETVDVQTARQNVANDTSDAAIIIPRGFANTLSSDTSASVLVEYVVANADGETPLLQMSIEAAAAKLTSTFEVANVSFDVAQEIGAVGTGAGTVDTTSTSTTYTATAQRMASVQWMDTPPVSVEVRPATQLRTEHNTVPTGVDQYSPGLLVMFALFLTVGGGGVLLREREQGTLRRLLVMPVGKTTILIGKLLGIYISSILQIATLILAGAFLFGVAWGQSPAALIMVAASYAFTATALGVMMAALVRTPAQLGPLSTILIMVLAALGGSWWPLEIVPAWMQTVAYFVPTTWAMTGFTDIISRGLGVEAVFLDSAVLCGFALLFLVVGIWNFQYE